MDDTAIRDMVISHDKVLDSLSENIKTLATTTNSTNGKLDKVVDELGKQNVLIERMNNMDKEVGESFKRVYERIGKMENTQDGDGCNAVKLVSGAMSDMDAKVANTSVNVQHIAEVMPEKVDYSVLKWFAAILIIYSVTFATYIVQSIGDLEKEDITITKTVESLDTKIGTYEGVHKYLIHGDRK